MPASGPLLTPEEIRAVLVEVGEHLASQGLSATVVIAGGSFLALNGWRADGTRDVDAVTRLDEAVKAAAAEVAGVHGFTVDWLNDRALPFVPATFEVDRCAVLIEHEGLRVLGPPPEVVLLMKLAAVRPGQDRVDMIALWPHCSFGSAVAAVQGFRHAYPMEPDDPHLVDYVTAIAPGGGLVTNAATPRGGKRHHEVRTFGTTTVALLALRTGWSGSGCRWWGWNRPAARHRTAFRGVLTPALGG